MALYGEPKMEEPLSIAQSRMEKKLNKEFAAAEKESGCVNVGKMGTF